MKTEELTMLTLVNQSKIAQDLGSLNRFASFLEQTRHEYLEIFKVFDIEKFNRFFNAKNPQIEMVKEWIEQEKIDLKGLNLKRAIEFGLINIPSLTPIIQNFGTIKNMLTFLPYMSIVQKDLGIMFNRELGRFPQSTEGETELFIKVLESNTYTTQNEKEVQFLQDVKMLSELFFKFTKTYRVKPKCDVPLNLFSISMYKEGEIIVNPTVLLQYRESNQ